MLRKPSDRLLENHARAGTASGRSRSRRGAVLCLLLGLAAGASSSVSAVAGEDAARSNRAFSYVNEKLPEGPWSIHLVRVERNNPDYEIQTMLANNAVSGMTTLSEQLKALPAQWGRPVAAVNGDFYFTSPRAYNGDPQGIQIIAGELISGPTEHACFWIDADGKPNTSVVQPLFRASWPHGSTTPFGLNEDRPGDGAVLYTPRMGPSTGTKTGGREYVLEATDKDAWLPLRVGTKLRARVREIRDAGDSPLKPDILILSLGPQLLVDAPVVAVNDEIELSTATAPSLAGAKTAIGGGPRLVVDGKPVNGWKSPNQRHPRTAIGWNNEYFYLMLVDGRQPGLSVGMSLQEMADYFIKTGCTHAMNLDGGGSASMSLFGQIVSSPSEGRERPIANGLVVIKKPKKEAP